VNNDTGYTQVDTGPRQGLTDHELALSFVEKYGDQLRYVSKWDKWFNWTGTHWKTVETQTNFDLIRKHIVAIGSRLNKAQTRKEMLSSKKTAAVERFVKSDQRISVETGAWDQHPYLLNTPGGTIDLLSGKIRPNNPADLLTQITAVAPAETVDCPLFLAFLDTIIEQRKDVIAYIQRWCGYCLSGDVSEEALGFGYGSGSNGKSKLIGAVAYVLGNYHRRTGVETFTLKEQDQHPTAIADLRGARFVTAVETKKSRGWDESLIKEMTGEESIKGRFMRQDFFDILVTWKLFIIGNHKPRLNSTGKAMRRRLQLWPFVVTIPDSEVDRKLLHKLKAEGPGILRWMIEGFAQWQKLGLSPPGFITDATQDYIDDEDQTRAWMEDCCVEEADAWTSTTELHRSNTKWRVDKNYAPLWINTFSSMLEEKGYAKDRPRDSGNNSHGFKGLRLTNQTDLEIPVQGDFSDKF
jgi:putative DNA primase/helicase